MSFQDGDDQLVDFINRLITVLPWKEEEKIKEKFNPLGIGMDLISVSQYLTVQE